AAGRLYLDLGFVAALDKHRHTMGESNIEACDIGKLCRDHRGQLVLLILQNERKSELVAHAIKIEFGDHRARNPVVKSIGLRYEAERDDPFGYAEIMQDVQGWRMDRCSALILDRRRLCLEPGDWNSALAERQRAAHADGPRPDDDDPLVGLASCHVSGNVPGLTCP